MHSESTSYLDILLETSCLSTLLVFVCTFLAVYVNTRRQSGVPPGPALLPIIGNLHNLVGNDVQGSLKHLRQQYGDIFGLYIGRELTVFLNGYHVLNDALVKHGRLFSDRPISEFHKLTIKYPGIFFNNGKAWKEQRTFALKCLQEVCFQDGGRNLENIINDELDRLLELLEHTNGPFIVDEYLHNSIGNVICMVLHRKRFDFNDKTFKTVLTYLRELAEEFTARGVLTNCFPFLNLLPGDVLGINSMLKKARAIRQVFWPPARKELESDEISLNDLYLDQIAATVEDKENHFTEEMMQSALYDLRAAGIDTSASVILWAILYLIRHSDVQTKLFQEIKRVIGLENKPTIKDRQELLFAEAFISEVMRISAAVPFALPHTVSRDTVFCGYLIPANCTVIANLESALKDPTVWRYPDEFRPERFLSDDKSRLQIPTEFIPFSRGPRSCIGESVARIEIFLFITTLVQKFEFLPEKDGNIPNEKGHLGVTWRPNPYRFRVKKRSIQS